MLIILNEIIDAGCLYHVDFFFISQPSCCWEQEMENKLLYLFSLQGCDIAML